MKELEVKNGREERKRNGERDEGKRGKGVNVSAYGI